MNIRELIEKAYKKTKSYAFYDKNLYHIRDSIARLESADPKFFEEWIEYLEKIILERKPMTMFEISVVSLPKNIVSLDAFEESRPSTSNQSSNDHIPDYETVRIITNIPKEYEIDRTQYYVQMPLECFVIGTLWVMLVGSKLDEGFTDNSYGNRVKTNTAESWSPFIFKLYKKQYADWRDKAIKQAERCLEDKKDCVFVVTDVKSFFYNVKLEPLIEEIWIRVGSLSETEQYLTKCVLDIIEKYNSIFKEKNKILPIGFTPSNVLANLYMDGFDKKICSRLAPEYYGRYVDDILIVKSLDLTEVLHKRQMTLQELFPCATNAFKGNNLVIETGGEELEMKTSSNKTKASFFSHRFPQTSLKVLKKTIDEITSEFRLMPDDDPDFENGYLEILNENLESIRKPSEISELSVNKTLLSASLGRTRMLCGLVSPECIKRKEDKILDLLDDGLLLENHSLWYRIMAIQVSNHNWDGLQTFVDRICLAISSSKFRNSPSDHDEPNRLEIDFQSFTNSTKCNLYQELFSALAYASTTYWGSKIATTIEHCIQRIRDYANPYATNVKDSVEYFDLQYFLSLRRGYCLSRMIGRVVSIPIDGFIKNGELCLDDEGDIDLLSISSVLKSQQFEITAERLESYPYRPHLLKYSDLCLYELFSKLSSHNSEFDESKWDMNSLYMMANYHSGNADESTPIVYRLVQNETEVGTRIVKESRKRITIVKNKRLDNITMALANTNYPSEDVMKRVIRRLPDRSNNRYTSIIRIFNEACRYDANMIVYPECSIPLDYVSLMARKCSQNDIALVGGIEYVIKGDGIYNILATILPFENKFEEPDAFIVFHLKKHYAPSEVKEAQDAGMKCVQGDITELFGWNNFWFSTLCCYEAASVDDRTVFKSLIDALIMVEYNRDVRYFSNIVESTVRDLHCFCVQCNNSNYGDSRITKPSKAENMDIVRIKGGIESNAAIGHIDLNKLRKYQIAPHGDDAFKPLPPGMQRELIQLRLHGELDSYLEKELLQNQ